MVVTCSWAGQFSSAKSSLTVQHASWPGTVGMPDITIRGVRRIIRPAVLGDTGPAAALLSRAFADDPLFAWIIPDERVRRQRLPGLFAAQVGNGALGDVARPRRGNARSAWY